MGNGAWVTLCLCCSFLLSLCPCSSTGSPRADVLPGAGPGVGCRESLVPGASSRSSSLTWVSAGLLRSHFSHPSLSQLLLCSIFYPFFSVITEAPPALPMGSVWPVAGLLWSGWGSFWGLVTEAAPAAPLLPKPGHVNPAHVHVLLRDDGPWTCNLPLGSPSL